MQVKPATTNALLMVSSKGPPARFGKRPPAIWIRQVRKVTENGGPLPTERVLDRAALARWRGTSLRRWQSYWGKGYRRRHKRA